MAIARRKGKSCRDTSDHPPKLIQWAPFLVFVVLVLAFTAINPVFFSLKNFGRIAISSTAALMVAIGVTFIIMGSIDLSTQGTISVGAVVFGHLFLQQGETLFSSAWVAIPVTFRLGAFLGVAQCRGACAAAHSVVHGLTGDAVCRHGSGRPDDQWREDIRQG